MTTRLRVTQFFVTLTIFFFFFLNCSKADQKTPLKELLKGFRAKPNPSSSSSSSSTASFFQPLLSDVTETFSFGFLRNNETAQLSIAVVHVASSEPLWIASGNDTILWSEKAEVAFNGSLVITDQKSRAEWSSHSSSSVNGDRMILLNSSNLQILKNDVVLWQSFDYPGNTLVENQNLSDATSLVSSNGQYSMKIGSDFWGLYAKFGSNNKKDENTLGQMYLKHTAMQAKAKVISGKSLSVRLEPNGYLAMYQTGTEPPVDLLPFTSYNRHVSGPQIVRLENDGNLKGYYWYEKKWVLSYEAISETCELPNPCGPYGLCKPGSGCSCLNNKTECETGGAKSSGDFCGVGKNDFSVIRKLGVELPFKELMSSETTSSLEECEGICVNNCSCWGSIYNNNTGFCYIVDYPIQTVLAVSDVSKAGFFKVREGVGRDKVGVILRVGICVLVGVILVFSGFGGVFLYRAWKRKRGQKGYFEDEIGGVSPGPYKDLGSASFRSIEMCNR